MSAGSARDRQLSGRRQNEAAEPFLLQQIPGSPVMRGRRQNAEEDSFPVEDIPGSPVIRGRRQNSEEERFLVEDIPGSPIVRGRVPRVVSSIRTATHEEAEPLANMSARATGFNPTSNTTDGPIRMPATAPLPSPTDSYATSATYSRPPNNDDAPPSYESSIPPTQIGWTTKVTETIPFPMPCLPEQGAERSSTTFSYPPSNPYPPIGLSPLATSYQSIESSRSKSPMRSTPSTSPSPIRGRPAYTYQTTHITTSPASRPQYRMENHSNHYTFKPQNELQYKYGGVFIAFGFVVFLMLLSLVVKFFIFRQKFHHG